MVAGSRHSGESTFKFASPVNGKKKPVKFSALSIRENSMGLGLTAETDKNGYCCSNASYNVPDASKIACVSPESTPGAP